MGQLELRLALEAAVREAKSRRHEYVTVEHLLYALLYEPQAKSVLLACGADLEEVQAGLEEFFDSQVPQVPEGEDDDPRQTIGVGRVLERAILHVQSAGKDELGTTDLLVAIRAEPESQAAWELHKQGISRLDLVEYISHGDFDDEGAEEEPELDNPFGSPEDLEDREDEDDSHAGTLGRPGRRKKEAGLASFTVDLTERARKGELDPLIGREEELVRIQQVLCRRRKNNPLLLGDPGVGKTAIVEGLAQRIAADLVPEVLQGATIYALDVGGLLAGTKYRGQFEKRFRSAIRELERKDNPILFIDDMHTIAGAGSTTGSSMDLSSLLKPVLQSGRVRCIGATTHDDFRRNLEKDRALVRRLQPIEIPEPSVEDAVLVLEGLRERYEEHHGVVYEHEALEKAAELADRHIAERYLPDCAIDVLDEVGAANHLRPAEDRKERMAAADVEAVVARIARIPELTAQQDERQQLQILEKEMKDQVYGQDGAIEAVVNAVKLSRAGLTRPDQPVGAFLFFGPTGVGKTEVARQLARVLGVGFVRFDMSEYMEKHAVARLIGAPPGYVGYDQGGLLTSAIRKTPHCVLLLDELEKAHQDLFDILLQVMDHATLTDNNGRQADFRNVILIMTSNAGAREMSRQGIGFGSGVDVTRGKKELERLFSPEFRNRLSEIVTFERLGPEVMGRIVDKFLAELQTQLGARDVTVELSDAARAWLAREGHDEVFGARPLARLIQRTIRQPLAEELLFGELGDGGTVRVEEIDGELVLETSAAASGKEPAPAH